MPVPQPFLQTMVQENLKVPARAWIAAFDGLLKEDSSGERDKLATPILIIWGDEDAMVPRCDQGALAGTIPNSRLLPYPGAGHALYW